MRFSPGKAKFYSTRLRAGRACGRKGGDCGFRDSCAPAGLRSSSSCGLARSCGPSRVRDCGSAARQPRCSCGLAALAALRAALLWFSPSPAVAPASALRSRAAEPAARKRLETRTKRLAAYAKRPAWDRPDVSWWAQQGSNLQPRDYESPAPPLSYGPGCGRYSNPFPEGPR